MIGAAIQEDVLRALVEQHAVRDCLVARIDGGSAWGVSVRLGGSGTRWVLVRSRRESLRTWASLTAAGRFADNVEGGVVTVFISAIDPMLPVAMGYSRPKAAKSFCT